MGYRLEDSGRILTLFLVFLLAAFAALIVAWIQGRRWGDLSSRMRYGEALTEEEKKQMKRSLRNFLIWAGASLALATLAFFSLRR